MAKLAAYHAKRDFGRTSEPKGDETASSGSSFVIQKHDATRLHYDLRLELDGVMKSWAVTKGPSLLPGEKRLAVHVEDHPIEYNAFEGTIPKGQYGGGTVMIWDRGRWEPVGDPHKGYGKGHLEFRLHGEKLSGAWHLVRMKKRQGERQEPWLLMKSDDEAAREEGDPDILDEKPPIGRDRTFAGRDCKRRGQRGLAVEPGARGRRAGRESGRFADRENGRGSREASADEAREA
jgi:bifunctional non-homologous end joining protein LigD